MSRPPTAPSALPAKASIFPTGGKKWGNFIAASGLNTGRFLDGPEYQVFHDHGNEENVFDRVDYKPDNAIDQLQSCFTRSWFQTPNSYDAQNATGWNGLVVDNGGLGPNGLPVGPTDQRSKIRTFNIAPVWTHILNPNACSRSAAGCGRTSTTTIRAIIRSPTSRPICRSATAGQNRRLTNAGPATSMSYVKGVHNIKIGAQYEHTFLTERDNFGLVDPTVNAPCLNADGSPDTDPTLTDPPPARAAWPIRIRTSFRFSPVTT